MYVISIPFLYFGKSVNVPFQLFDEFNVSVFPFTATLFAYNVTVTEVDLKPSWLLLSDHDFVTGIFIVSGVPVNSTVSVSGASDISTIGCSASPVPLNFIWFDDSVPFSHKVFFVTLLVISIFIFTVVAKFLATFT